MPCFRSDSSRQVYIKKPAGPRAAQRGRFSRWMFLSVAFFFAGCAYYPNNYGAGPNLSTSLGQVNAMVGDNQPVEYRVGYRDGCDSGHSTQGNTAYSYKKDTQRTQVDAQYRSGWDAGYAQCQSYGSPSSNYSSYYYPRYRYPGTYFGVNYYGGGYYPRYYSGAYFYPWSGYSPYIHLNFGRRHFRHRHHHHGHRHRGGFVRRGGGGRKGGAGGRGFLKSR